MEDPHSTAALAIYGAAAILAWLFGRAERMLRQRSQAALDRLIDQADPLGGHFLRWATKRRVALALGIGHIAAAIVLVAVAFVEAHRWVFLGSLPPVGAYLLAGLASVVPLALAHVLMLAAHIREDVPPVRVRFFSPLVALWTALAWPIVWPLDRLQTHLASQPETKEAREEAFMALVEADTEAGIIEADKREMISSIMNIDETTVREVMVPRVDIVAVERSRPLAELLALFVETQHSRIPIYDQRIDHIVGIVHAKDVLQTLVTAADGDPGAIPIDRFVRESSLLFVPTNKKIDELLREFRREKKHMAVVVDEYGGTAGIVTMEDILEEIVGEIRDEYDVEEEVPYRWLDDRQVEVDAGMDIADVNELMGSDLPEENGYDTLAGFLYHQFAAIPAPGATTTYGRYRFVVRSVDAQRIDKVLIEILPSEDHGEKAAET